MANGFIIKNRRQLPDFLKRFSVVIIMSFLFIVFILGVGQIGASTIDKQQESLESALERDIIQCYCLEGMYPPSLDYIKKHYGLSYDEDLFFVDYRPIASNLYPDVTIICINGADWYTYKSIIAHLNYIQNHCKKQDIWYEKRTEKQTYGRYALCYISSFFICTKRSDADRSWRQHI